MSTQRSLVQALAGRLMTREGGAVLCAISNEMITFRVSDVERRTDRLPTTDTRGALALVLGEPLDIEACSEGRFVSELPYRGWNPLLSALDLAFSRHLPLVLSPDVVWLCVAQALSATMRAEGPPVGERELVQIEFNDFRIGASDNPWPAILDRFAEAMREREPLAHDRLVASFSTTGPAERAACAVTLMDALQERYRYEGITLCGIPEITLLGTPEDWAALRERVHRLEGIGPEGWKAALAAVCDKLSEAAAGRADADFFRSIYKRNQASGGPHINGWINVLFPLVGKRLREENRYAGQLQWPALDVDLGDDSLDWSGARHAEAPVGLSRAPLLWRVLVPLTERRYELLAGLIGVSQDPVSAALRPEIGWAVRTPR